MTLDQLNWIRLDSGNYVPEGRSGVRPGRFLIRRVGEGKTTFTLHDRGLSPNRNPFVGQFDRLKDAKAEAEVCGREEGS